MGPTDMKPNAVVETTSAERRALDNSARLEIFDFDCGGTDVVVDSLLPLFAASFASIESDCKIFFVASFSSSLFFDEVEEEKNEM